MNIDLFLSRSEIQAAKIANRVAVIIDVWRASTSIITALANGCAGIIPDGEVESAKERARGFSPDAILLGGERNELPIPGFDLSNSPLDYTVDRVKDRRIIFTSSNGAKLFKMAVGASRVIVAGFLNVSAVSDFVLSSHQDIAILCAGKNDQFGLEDAVCGGMIIDQITKQAAHRMEIKLNDGALAARILYDHYATNLSAMIEQSVHGKRLLEIGQQQDLLISLAVDSRKIVPILRNDELVSYDAQND